MRVKGIWIRGKGGAALITAIVFVFFLTLFGLAFYRLGETDIDLFGYEKNLSKSLYASEAGFDKVRWMLRESHQVSGANPFSSAYIEANAIAIANPTEGDFFPGETDKPYFKVSEIKPELISPGQPGSRVKVQVLGSVDVDADGEAGLTASEDGFTFDPDDVNRRFEAYVGLPGSLGERIGEKGFSATATVFYAGGVPINLLLENRPFVTLDGDSMNAFRYFGSGTSGNWDQWGFIFSEPVKTAEIELPPGIFDESGDYVDDDNNGIPDYFQDLDRRTYTGDQTFDGSKEKDPTAGAEGRSVIYVNGNITIDSVDFGHLNDQGQVKNSDWEKRDLTFIANGDITLNRVDCGNVGRLVLVAKNITLVGDYDTKVNGIAIAFNDITVDGSGCPYGILTHQTDYSRPVKYTAYFLGTMLAKNRINLQNDGWTVIYDENVINGYMYSTVQPKPTLTYDRMEAEDFNSSNNWRPNESTPELLHRQGRYTEDEINTLQGDYADGGADTLPELMRVYIDRPRWGPKGPNAIGETLSLDFSSGDFEDPDIPDRSPQNWEYYDTITFWITLDNFKWTSADGTKTTRREARYQIRLSDSGGNTIFIPLANLYPESKWGTVRYHHTGTPEEYTNEIRDLTDSEKANGERYSIWKRIKFNPKPDDIPPAVDFDFGNVVELGIRYIDLRLSWTVEVGKPDAKVEWTGSYFRYTDEDVIPHSIDGKLQKGDPYDESNPDDGYYYLYHNYDEITGIYSWVKWIEHPESSTEQRIMEEVLMPTLRIDRVELPGKPATNDHLEYGLPHSLRLEVTNWHEL